MRKLVLVLVVMILLVLACTLPRKAQTPATPPPTLPTSAPTQPPQPLPTDIPSSPTTLPTQTTAPTETLQPTATLQPTETPMPTAIPPTATSLPTATSAATEFASLLFEDDFSTDKGVWPQDGDENDGISVTNIIDGQLVTNAIERMYDIFIPLDFAVDGPVLIDVEAELMQGDISGSYGIMCAYKDDDNYYGMTASENGYIEIYRWENGERETLEETTNTTVVKQGKNSLQAICDKDMLGFFVNNELVGSYLSLSALSGDVGLLAGTLDLGNITVGFDNFVMTRLNYETETSLPTEAPTASPAAPTEEVLADGILFVDEFDSDNGLWAIDDDKISTEVISDGQLTATIHETYYDISIPLDKSFSGPLQIDVDASRLIGHKNTGYGVVCGLQEGGDYYGMTVTDLRHASIFKWGNDTRTPLWDLYDVAAINKGGNHISAVCNGKTLEFYVNGKLLKTLTTKQPIEGMVGVMVQSFGSDEVTLGFDNFVVTSLE